MKSDRKYLKSYFLPQIQTAESDKEVISVLEELSQVAYADGVADTDIDFNGKENIIKTYNKELKYKIKELLELYKFKYTYELDDGDEETVVAFDLKLEEEILELLKWKQLK